MVTPFSYLSVNKESSLHNSVVGRGTAFQRLLSLTPQKLWTRLPLYSKSDFKNVTKLRISRWEIILDYQNGPDITHELLKLKNLSRLWSEGDATTQDGSERDLKLLVLKTEKRGKSQGMQTTSRSWRRQGNEFSPSASRKEHSLARNLILA